VSEQGRHLGGIIAPGLLTAQRAVLGATRFATRDERAHYTLELGRDTEACVRQGAYHACVGAIVQASAPAGARAQKFITGGDAALLARGLDAGWQQGPQLVLEGLLALALDST
ncbi:MAG TPA: type III pantothenate kinase, partial [Nevskiaceae bacterium]|nr:type III pantothenate kinase [Nevskiaceae bacterium]